MIYNALFILGYSIFRHVLFDPFPILTTGKTLPSCNGGYLNITQGIDLEGKLDW